MKVEVPEVAPGLVVHIDTNVLRAAGGSSTNAEATATGDRAVVGPHYFLILHVDPTSQTCVAVPLFSGHAPGNERLDDKLKSGLRSKWIGVDSYFSRWQHWRIPVSEIPAASMQDEADASTRPEIAAGASGDSILAGEESGRVACRLTRACCGRPRGRFCAFGAEAAAAEAQIVRQPLARLTRRRVRHAWVSLIELLQYGEMVPSRSPIPACPLGLVFWISGNGRSRDLTGNATRGRLAEYIVARALGISTGGVRDEWAACDLCTTAGVQIEVKSAAYLQSWQQTKPSTISFSIKKSRPWDAKQMPRRGADSDGRCLRLCAAPPHG